MLKNLSAIDTNRDEGRYLMAAINMLSNTGGHIHQHPNTVLEGVGKLTAEMYRNVPLIPEPTERPAFGKALTTLLNQYSKDVETNTPDWVLFEFIEDMLAAYGKANTNRAFASRQLA